VAESGSLKGHLLIATPALLDPNFHRSVVLILEHTSEGALGLILNRPSGVAASDVVPDLSTVVDDEDEVFVGGPVQPEAVIALAEFSEPLGEDSGLVGPIAALDMGEDIEEVIERIARVRLFAGYAGWGEGQLDGEVDEEAWFTEPALPGDVFSDDHSTLWNRVLRRKGSRYRLVASMPEDPSLN
jgi:putative transcriptional regulator